ncbi:MAG: ATP-binding cassette domain-containing protein, partial [Clostridia bacterium]|nr:ATP-binding cassette domain-containing protein [Clostridia bacterium]
KDIAKLSDSIDRTKSWADRVEASKYGKASSGLRQDKGYVGHKSAKMMKRAKAIEERKTRAIEQKSQLLNDAETAEDIKIYPLDYHSKNIINCTALEIYRAGKRICGPIDFGLMSGERLALAGCNGSGKSRIVKLIAGEDITHKGIIALSSGVIVSYVPQTAENLCGTLSQFVFRNKLDMPLFRGTLVKLGFESCDFDGNKDISSYSQGQKKKILLAKSLCERAHLYVWDEPFNYLDLYARMQIEDAVKKYNLTMVFVEHDTAFTNAVADKIIVLD